MANNCYNYIVINGSKEEIQSFREVLTSKEGQENGCDIYENLVNEHPKHQENAKWFDMDIHNLEEPAEEEIIISGDSAWNPSLELFGEISKKYPSFKIRYEYEERGCDFAGFAEISEGNVNDNCFSFWKGKVEIDENTAYQSAVEEISEYEDEEELIDSDMYKAFPEISQAQLIQEFRDLLT
jgi:hypothetical protein